MPRLKVAELMPSAATLQQSHAAARAERCEQRDDEIVMVQPTPTRVETTHSYQVSGSVRCGTGTCFPRLDAEYGCLALGAFPVQLCALVRCCYAPSAMHRRTFWPDG
jgi:hypothetical protein